MDQIRADIAEIKADVKELIKQGAAHNEILRTHEARSLALQSAQDKLDQRVIPIQKHVDILNAVGKLLTGLLVGLLLQWLVKRFVG